MVRAAKTTVSCTPWMFNIDPKSRPKSEQEFPNHHSSDAMFFLGRVLLRWGEVFFVHCLKWIDTFDTSLTHSLSCMMFWLVVSNIFFSSLFGEMIQFDYYFSDGLKPPTSVVCFQKKNHSICWGFGVRSFSSNFSVVVGPWLLERAPPWQGWEFVDMVVQWFLGCNPPNCCKVVKEVSFKYIFFTAMLHIIWFNVFASIFVGETKKISSNVPCYSFGFTTISRCLGWAFSSCRIDCGNCTPDAARRVKRLVKSPFSLTKHTTPSTPMGDVHFIYPSNTMYIYTSISLFLSQLEHLQGTRKLDEKKGHEGKNSSESESPHDFNLNIHVYLYIFFIHVDWNYPPPRNRVYRDLLLKI